MLSFNKGDLKMSRIMKHFTGSILVVALFFITSHCSKAQFTFPNNFPAPTIDASSGFNGIWETMLHDGNPTEGGVTEFDVADFCGVDPIVDPLLVTRQSKTIRLKVCANGNMLKGSVKVIMSKLTDYGKKKNIATISNTSAANKALRKAKIITTVLTEDKVDSNGDSRSAQLVLKRGMIIYNLDLSVFEDGDLSASTVSDLSAMGIEILPGDLLGAFNGNFSTCQDEFALGIWKKIDDNPVCP